MPSNTRMSVSASMSNLSGGADFWGIYGWTHPSDINWPANGWDHEFHIRFNGMRWTSGKRASGA